MSKISEIPHLVSLDESGKVLTDSGVMLIGEYVKDFKARENQSLRTILESLSRNYTITANGDKVDVTNLQGKKVCLYVMLSTYKDPSYFTGTLVKVNNELKAKDENFEIVMIPLDDNEESFNKEFSVVIGPNGKTLHPNVADAVEEYCVIAYPFTPDKFVELEKIEKAKQEAETLESVLVSGDLDFVLGKDGANVNVTNLQGKTVGLYVMLSTYKDPSDFTGTLVKVNNELKAKDENFEIVMIPLDDNEESFNKEFSGLLVVIGPNGKTLHPNVADAVEEYCVIAYPFTPDKFVELEKIEKAKQEAETLESVLVSGDLDFVLGKDGANIPVCNLVGKHILLYFSAHWCRPSRAFTPKLAGTYHEIKTKDEAFEVIFISSDKDQASYVDYS
ncbi:probable nucleoredoxin 1 [Tanacetum coccineum]